MFWTILVLLVALWLLGMVTSRRVGGLIHALPAMAVVLLVVRLTSSVIDSAGVDSGRFLGAGNEPTVAGL